MLWVFKGILLVGIMHGVGMIIGRLSPTFGFEPTFGRVVITVLLFFVGLVGYVMTKPESSRQH